MISGSGGGRVGKESLGRIKIVDGVPVSSQRDHNATLARGDDYLARSHDDRVPVLPAQRTVRSYWTAIHENLRDLSRVRAAVQFLVESVREAQSNFLINNGQLPQN